MSRNSTFYILGIIALTLAIMSSVLTDRTHAVTFTVNSTGDGPDSDLMDGICNDGSGACTLRAAIEQANSTVGLDTINFSIGGGGLQTISPTSPLPPVFDPAIVDATTQPGFSGVPIIQLSGVGAGAGSNGLVVLAGSSTVRGFVINRFSANGIVLAQRPGNTVETNYIGTDTTGNNDLGNTNNGILIQCPSNTVGGTMASQRNVISGNDDNGIQIDVGEVPGVASGNTVIGNYIGTNASAGLPTPFLGNSNNGVQITSPGNIIGGFTSASRNIISANFENGVIISGEDADNNRVLGNHIGTDPTNTFFLGNVFDGVVLEDGPDGNEIGDSTSMPGSAPGNIIIDNGGDGIEIDGDFDDPGNTTATIVQGNLIGLTPTNTSLGNEGNGIFINNSPGNTIGGDASERNVISGQEAAPVLTCNGIEIAGDMADGNIIEGNHIGVSIDGDTVRRNHGNGIKIHNGASNNTIGSAGKGNVISGNDKVGVLIRDEASDGNTLKGNRIGTNAAGNLDRGNLESGVYVHNGSDSTVIGGALSTEANIIAGNNQSGVVIEGILSPGNTTNNQVIGNRIGTDLSGTVNLGNTDVGVLIVDTNNNMIGNVVDANFIYFNGNDGVFVDNGTGNTIRGNSIHANGGLGIDLFPDGVTPNDPDDTDTGANNLQNFPFIASATQGSTIVQGTLNSTANTQFTIDFYSSPTPDPTNHGEGKTYLGATFVTASGSGNASFNTTLATTVPLGHVISATTTEDLTGNTSEFSVARTVVSPTEVTLVSFNATAYDKNVLLEWQTGFEVDNLGFNVYRDTSGRRELVNQQMIAGSALVAGSGVVMQAGRSYAWWDNGIADCGLQTADCRNAQYWLEDVDIDGKSTLHGPCVVKLGGSAPPAHSQAALLSQIGIAQPIITSQTTPSLLHKPDSKRPSAGQTSFQASLAAGSAIKLGVREEGWYRVSQSELLSAGLDPNADPRYLQLFAGAVEQPLLVAGESDGRLDPAGGIEFYAKGLDTPSSDTRVYWLVTGKQLGKRVNIVASHGKPGGAQSFSYTVEYKERSIYFSSLLNGEVENFFGRVVASEPVDQTIPVEHLDAASSEATVEIALQGVTNLAASPDHRISVSLNGSIIGHVIFDGREHRVERFSVYGSQLREGNNTVTLTGKGGADVTLIDYICISYDHTYFADDDEVKLTASNATGPTQTIGGFSTPLIRVIDVSDPLAVQELAGQIEQLKGGSFAVTVDLTGNEHALIAFADNRIKRPAWIVPNDPSSLRSAANRADLLIITSRELAASLEPLRALRQSQGLSVAIVDVQDIYDEFNFGEKSSQSLKDLIKLAATSWQKKPRFVLLAGDASYDSRNYLGLGDRDLVPTRLIDTLFMETASDEWLADANDDGLADVAVGRLPARTVAEASTMVAKIVAYERSAAAEEVLLVSDENTGYDFESASGRLMLLAPAGLKVNRIDRGRVAPDVAKKSLVDAINRGQKVVNYAGHGSAESWNGRLINSSEARGLANAHLPVFVMMTCLNGYFQDPMMESLGEALLKVDAGAVAVWASTGMTMPFDQWTMNEELYRLIFGGSGLKGESLTLGEAVGRAKAKIADTDIRRTWVLLGDPSMKLR